MNAIRYVPDWTSICFVSKTGWDCCELWIGHSDSFAKIIFMFRHKYYISFTNWFRNINFRHIGPKVCFHLNSSNLAVHLKFEIWIRFNWTKSYDNCVPESKNGLLINFLNSEFINRNRHHALSTVSTPIKLINLNSIEKKCSKSFYVWHTFIGQ